MPKHCAVTVLQPESTIRDRNVPCVDSHPALVSKRWFEIAGTRVKIPGTRSPRDPANRRTRECPKATSRIRVEASKYPLNQRKGLNHGPPRSFGTDGRL